MFPQVSDFDPLALTRQMSGFPALIPRVLPLAWRLRRYARLMALASVPADTSPEVFDVLVERWRTMSIGERFALIEQLNADVESIAIAGIRADQPDASEVQIRHQLARRRYGSELADEAFLRLLA